MRSISHRVRTRLRRTVRGTEVGRSLHRWGRRLRVQTPSRFDNIYHCCTQRTASQWIRNLLDDPLVQRRCGLELVPYAHMGLRSAHFSDPFPLRTIIAHLYVDHPTYAAVPKPSQYRTFFVLRDPRDIVVSWYFSVRYSNLSGEGVDELRPELQRLSTSEGLCHVIDWLDDWGLFAAQRSWVESPASDDPEVRLFQYEQLAEDRNAFASDLLNWLEISLEPAELDRLMERHTFSAHAGGRPRGEEQIGSHYRKGIVGDWPNHFDDQIMAHFHAVTGDLVKELGYSNESV